MENEQIEETQDTSTEDVNNEEKGEEDTKDYKAEALKYKAIAERKDKKLREALEGDKPEEEPKKPNTEQDVPTMEHVALFGQGATMEQVQFAEKLAKVEGISLTEAFKSDVAKTKFAILDKEAQVKANSLPASGGTPPAQREKSIGNLDDNEHRQLWEEKSKNASNE